VGPGALKLSPISFITVILDRGDQRGAVLLTSPRKASYKVFDFR
jgi:hypothetical protein